MRHAILFAGAALLAAPVEAQGPNEPAPGPADASLGVEFTTGLDYEEGDYGTYQKVATTSVPLGLRASSRSFHFSATLPYVRVDAPANVLGGGGLLGMPIIIDPTEPSTRVRREGIGDLRLGAAYTLPSKAIGLTVSSQVKIPTASADRGLGTGEVDYAMGAEIFKTLGQVTPFASVAYTLPGDPAEYELRNSVSARAGAALQMSPGLRGHVSYGYAQSASPLVPDEQQIATGLQASLSPRLSLGVYGAAGLSEGAPDVAAGVHLGFQIR